MRKQRLHTSRLNILAGALAATLLAAAPAAQAGPIEDAFRGFLDRMRGQGQSAAETPFSKSTREVKKLEFGKRNDQLPLGKTQVAVFTDNGCKSCKGAVDDLRKRGWNVEVFNLSTNATARQTFALTGAKGVPAVLIGTVVMSGYSPKLLEQALAQDAANEGNAMQGQGS